MKRSSFDLSFLHTLSADMGYLVPVAAIDVLPGDSFRIHSSALARVAPLAKPVMHPVDLRIHWFYVPNRILWSDWEDFITGESAAVYPTLTPANAAQTVLYDHMGVERVTGVALDALPIRAYNLIFNEFYRDQDLVTARAEGDLTLAQIAWGKDYFTTARANPQQGTAVEVNFAGGTIPVSNLFRESTTSTQVIGEIQPDGSLGATANQANAALRVQASGSTTTSVPEVDLSNATGGIDINDLRRAIALQRIAEAREFAGSRYVDYLRWYGINPSDGRLDRPEYLGGGRQQISFSEVLATAEGTTTDVGDLYGHGIAGLRSRPFRKFFEEHGWVIGLLSVRPKGIYQNGIPRRFLRREATDFWHRELELLPWQSVAMREVWGAAAADTIFGYTPRYDEYREIMSYVSGTLRQGTEEDWTLAREFAAQPTLNASFVTCTPSDRIYQDATQPELIVTIKNNIMAKRLVAANARMGNYAGI